MSADEAELLSLWSSLQFMFMKAFHWEGHRQLLIWDTATLELRCSQCRQWFPVSPYLNDPTMSHDSSPECKLYWNHVNDVAHVFHIGNVGMETPCWWKKMLELANWLHLGTFSCVSASFISDWWHLTIFIFMLYKSAALWWLSTCLRLICGLLTDLLKQQPVIMDRLSAPFSNNN